MGVVLPEISLGLVLLQLRMPLLFQVCVYIYTVHFELLQYTYTMYIHFVVVCIYNVHVHCTFTCTCIMHAHNVQCMYTCTD